MRIAGKVICGGLGFLLGNVIGAALGLWIGHRFDKALSAYYAPAPSEEATNLFFITSFAVMGHVAKSKGVVTAQEIQMASQRMDRFGLHGQVRERAQQAFREGKAADFPLEDKLSELKQVLMGHNDLLRAFMDCQVQLAFADGELDDAERRVLERIAVALGFSASQLDLMIRSWALISNFHRHQSSYSSSHQGQTRSKPRSDLLNEAYSVLGVDAKSSDQEVKRAYRKLMSQHHPDKMMAKGLPPEMMELAKERAQDIQKAYELVKSARNMR